MASEFPKEWWDDTIPPPARDCDWKPGESVLIDAVVETSNNGCATVKIKGQLVSLHEDLVRVRLGASSIHPHASKLWKRSGTGLR